MDSGADRYEVIVIGVGGMGSAACYHLARRGQGVLGIERFDVPHDRGSSHGESRIIRKANYELPAAVPVLERSYELWEALETAADVELVTQTGYAAIGPPGSQVPSGAKAACERHDLAYDVMSGARFCERYPGFDLPEDVSVVLEADGGFVPPERCTVAHVEQAQLHGAEIHTGERVMDWSATPAGGVTVRTDRGRYRADRLVVTAGAWAAELLPELARLAVPERQVLGWFQPTAPAQFTPGRFPVFSMACEQGRFYGFPTTGDGGVKIGKHGHRNERVDPDAVPTPADADEALLRSFTETYLPTAAGPTNRLATCLFTNSPDEMPIVDRHPDYADILVATGFSGHGYKMASAVGDMLAQLAIDGTVGTPTNPFHLDRFG